MLAEYWLFTHIIIVLESKNAHFQRVMDVNHSICRQNFRDPSRNSNLESHRNVTFPTLLILRFITLLLLLLNIYLLQLTSELLYLLQFYV